MREFIVAQVLSEARFGGPQHLALQVSDKLRDYGVRCILFFPFRNAEFFKNKLKNLALSYKKIALYPLSKNFLSCIRWLFGSPFSVTNLYFNIKYHNVDLVHIHNTWNFQAVIAGKLAGKRVVLDVHDSVIPLPIKPIFFASALLSDGIIVRGKKTFNKYNFLKNFFQKTAIIQAPVDTSIFDPVKVQPNKKIASYPGIKIGTVANINPAKGIEYFVGMCKILNEKYKNLTFFIIGSKLKTQKKYTEKIYKMIERYKISNLVFYGKAESVPEVLKALDIYVCSSVTEASPMSVWEAMAMEKAIVSTDVGDVAQFIKDGENGFVVPVRNPQMLAERVRIFIENPKLRVKFGKQARKVAVQKLDIEICVKKHYEFYKKVLTTNK
jgi:glycosyltransferase involved in cell wall biosynthesis